MRKSRLRKFALIGEKIFRRWIFRQFSNKAYAGGRGDAKKAAAWGQDPDGCEAEEYSVRSYSARDSTATCRGISGVTARVGPG